MSLVLIILTLLYINSKNVKYIFPLTDWTQRQSCRDNLTLTLFVDLVYLLISISLYLTSCQTISMKISNTQLTVFLIPPDLLN